ALIPDICYEDLFGEEIARTLRAYAEQPGILVNSTNLAWFGNTIAVDQHLQISRMRALETGRPVLRATNAGATAAIDAEGRVISELTPFTVGVLSARVQGTRGATPYVRYGNVPVIALALLVIGLAVGKRAWPRGR
ncbi:MAG: nitrilase-related carbon-nitrogen hydrolase, partial [Burkholderiales bacterium]